MKKTMTILDVRTPDEFAGGSARGSINIPLGEIPNRLEEIRRLPGPITLCCASGNRSGQATAYLRSVGLDCENGGCWNDMENLMNS